MFLVLYRGVGLKQKGDQQKLYVFIPLEFDLKQQQ